MNRVNLDRFACHPLQLVLGLSVWALWFVVAYGALSVACAFMPPAVERGAVNWLNGALLLLTLLTTAGLLWAGWWCWRAAQAAALAGHARSRFVAAVSAGLHAGAAASTVFVGLPLFVLPPCL